MLLVRRQNGGNAEESAQVIGEAEWIILLVVYTETSWTDIWFHVWETRRLAGVMRIINFTRQQGRKIWFMLADCDLFNFYPSLSKHVISS